MTGRSRLARLSKSKPPSEVTLLNRLVTAAGDVCLVIGADGAIDQVSVNDPRLKALDWERWVGQRWADTVAPDSVSKVSALLNDARAGGTPRPREINQRVSDGTMLPLRYSAVRLEQGDQVLVLGRDLQAHANLQQQILDGQRALDREFSRLRQTEARYRLLFQVASEPMLLIDLAAMRVAEVNGAAERLLGLPAGELSELTLQQLFEKLFEPSSWDQVDGLIAQFGPPAPSARRTASSTGKSSKANKTAKPAKRSATKRADVVLRRVGTGEPIRLSVTPIGPAETPMVALHLGVAAVRKPVRGRRSYAVLDAIPEGFVVIDAERRVLFANLAFEKLVESTEPGGVVGERLDRWFGRPDATVDHLLAQLEAEPEATRFATTVLGERGGRIEVSLTAVAAPDAEVPCFGLSIRPASARLTVVPEASPVAGVRSIDQLRALVGRVSLAELVQEGSQLIERLCLEAALQNCGGDRPAAARLLGLSRDAFVLRLNRHGLGSLH